MNVGAGMLWSIRRNCTVLGGGKCLVCAGVIILPHKYVLPMRTNHTSTLNVPHMILSPRPSRFSASNIEKLGAAWVRG